MLTSAVTRLPRVRNTSAIKAFYFNRAGIALDPTTAASVLLGDIGFMKAAFGLRFLPAFFAFFFAISVSPLNGVRLCDPGFFPR